MGSKDDESVGATSGFDDEMRTGPEMLIAAFEEVAEGEGEGLLRFVGRERRFDEEEEVESREKRDARVVEEEGSAKCRGPRGEVNALGVVNILLVKGSR